MTRTFRKTEKQAEAVRLMTKHIELLMEGGSRSGKTFIAIDAMIKRCAKHEGTKHLIVRRHFAHVKSIWYETFPDVIKADFPTLHYKQNKTDWFIEFDNGSQIWFAGTDDKERIEKLLGWEWETIFINEGSQIPFDTYETLKTRLNPRKGVKPLFLIDYNPPSTMHWGYVIFHKKLNYETKQPLENTDRYALISMNPTDNIENLSDTYIDTLKSMSEKKRKRFLLGQYSDATEGALWDVDWILKSRVSSHPESLMSVVVGVDPAVTGNDNSDSTGIIVAARAKVNGEDHYYILADNTVHGSVTGWGLKAAETYNKYSADCVVGESNQGGDLVEMNIRNYDRNIKYKAVRATRGKAMRAEPIADLYERGLVHHVGEFPELEEQMITWTPESDFSPDNLDACVWALSYLAGIGDSSKIIIPNKRMF